MECVGNDFKAFGAYFGAVLEGDFFEIQLGILEQTQALVRKYFVVDQFAPP